MTPRRIAYVLKIFPKLSETFIANELIELRRRGMDLRILSLLPPRDGLRHEFIHDAGLEEITSYEPAEFPRVLARFRPDLLHAHFATESTAKALDLAAELGLPCTFTCHGYDIYRKPPPDFEARAHAARAVITVSHANASYIQRAFALKSGRLRVIPCGVDTTHFKPRAEPLTFHEHGSLSQSSFQRPVIVCVARLVTVKNLELLIRACALLRARGVLFHCIIAGDGPCRLELENRRAQLRLEDCIDMPGAIERKQVLKLWQSAAVGVLTSTSEGMPVSLMEAAACGVPVVATAVGGIPELVQDGVTGLLTPVGNAEALATGIQRLLRHPELRATMSLAARERAEIHFSVARQVDALLALWADVLEQDQAEAVRRGAAASRVPQLSPPVSSHARSSLVEFVPESGQDHQP